MPYFESFARSVLGWSFSPKFYAGTEESPLPPELEVALPEFEETLTPDFAVGEPDPLDDGPSWQLIVQVLETGEDFDAVHRGVGGLEASPHGRMERLLRQTGVLAGVLFNGTSLRVISAPRGESSGWLDFRVADMLTTAGRPICTRCDCCSPNGGCSTLPRGERLTALLEDSRRYQNEVSERLAEQVLHALYELLRGFQAANDASGGQLLRITTQGTRRWCVPRAAHGPPASRLPPLRGGARDAPGRRSVRPLLLARGPPRAPPRGCRAVPRHDGSAVRCVGTAPHPLPDRARRCDGAASLHLPERHGVLFDPDRFPFLEGRPSGGSRQIHERIEAPLVPDGTIYRALEKLLVLDGERISYRALDVEQIGSVYETMMGFRLESANWPLARYQGREEARRAERPSISRRYLPSPREACRSGSATKPTGSSPTGLRGP